jgi:hypothetical protein
MLFLNHLPRIAQDNAVRGDIKIHIRIGRNQNIISDGDLSHHDRACTDPDLVSNVRAPFALATVGLPDCYSVSEIAIVAKNCILMDYDVAEMSYVKPFADSRLQGNLKTKFIQVPAVQDLVKKP